MQDFRDTSVRIKGVTKNKLDKICKEYQYIKINDCINDMVEFFIKNGLSPQTNLHLNLHESVAKINKDFIKRDDSFRKWFGDLYFKKLSVVISNSNTIYQQNEMILKLIKNDVRSLITESIEENRNEVGNQSNTSNKDMDEFKSKMYKILETKEKLIENFTKVNALQKKNIQSLIKKAENKSAFSSSYIIKLTKEEYENLKQISV